MLASRFRKRRQALVGALHVGRPVLVAQPVHPAGQPIGLLHVLHFVDQSIEEVGVAKGRQPRVEVLLAQFPPGWCV